MHGSHSIGSVGGQVSAQMILLFAGGMIAGAAMTFAGFLYWFHRE
jgi:hypothetical protein